MNGEPIPERSISTGKISVSPFQLIQLCLFDPMSNVVVTRKNSYQWIQRLMALLALLNLLLVCFELSYSYCRDVYLHYVPALVQQYDRIKDIEPHPETQYYLSRVDALETEITQSGLDSEPTAAILAELRSLSQQMILTNPFAAAKKSRVLAKVERELSDRTNSAFGIEGFNQFWSQAHLSTAGWQSELAFFDQKLRPLIAANYYRDLNLIGKFVDRFWWIDTPFMLIFALDILIRSYRVSRRRPDLNWLEAILRRWYDFFLLLPFWRWLRVIPVITRLYQANLINLDPLRAQANRDFAINFAGQMTEMVGLQLIDQMQESIERGEAARWLLYPEARQPYVDVNNTNELEAIATRLLNVSIRDVLPKIQPDLEALLRHGLSNSFYQSPIYQRLGGLPGFNNLPDRITEQLSKDLAQAVCSNLVHALDDRTTAQLMVQLAKSFRDSLEQELQKTHNVDQFQSWLVDLLEEIKINYVNRLSEVGIEQVVEEAEQLQRLNYRARSDNKLLPNY
jgi:hypothetical protein